MKFVCSVRNGQQCPEILEHIEHRMEQVKKLERRKCTAQIVIDRQRHLHEVEIVLRGARVDMAANGKTDDIRQAIDQAFNRLCRQLTKRRGKIRSRRHNRLDKKLRRAPSVWEFDSLRGALHSPNKKAA